MSHGSPRINICHNCKQYTLVNRFSNHPICPDCGKESEQTTKEEIRNKYSLSFFYDFILGFGNWTKIIKQ